MSDSLESTASVGSIGLNGDALWPRPYRKRRQRSAGIAVFLWEIAMRGRRVGAIAPTSRSLARMLVDTAGVRSADRIVELGAGTGAVTGEIVRAMRSGARVLALERNRSFVDVLRHRFPEIDVRCDCAGGLLRHARELGVEEADCVLSSLPWTCFPEDLTLRILQSAATVLRPEGVFTTIACVGVHQTRSGRKFHARLREFFGDVQIGRVNWRNFPPAFVYRCTEPKAVRG